uniref:Uncharacterized protein n=1 Tax=Cairina moschata TaxID=8855 RepID=A0A8C3GFX0_CAIMO
MGCSSGWGLSTAHPEILGVHVQLVTVKLAQLSKTLLDVVQVLHSFPEGGEHFLAMGTDHGVASDGGGAGQVPEGGEEPLGPGVDNQQPGLGTTVGHIDLAPEAGDELLLLGCPVHHGAEQKGLLELRSCCPLLLPTAVVHSRCLCCSAVDHLEHKFLVRENEPTWKV